MNTGESPTSFFSAAKWAENSSSTSKTPNKSSLKNQAGRHTADNRQGGRGGRSGSYNQGGRGRGFINNSADPWNGIDYAKPKFTAKGQLIFDTIHRRNDNDFHELDTLTCREGDMIVLCKLMTKITEVTKAIKSNPRYVFGLRDKSRAQMIHAIRDEATLKNLISELNDDKWTKLNQHSAPALYFDLIGDPEAIFAEVESAKHINKGDIIFKKIIVPYFMRHFYPSAAIQQVMENLSQLDYEHLTNFAVGNNVLCKYIWKTVGNRARYVPLDIPEDMEDILWAIATAQLPDNSTTKREPKMTFSERVARESNRQSKKDATTLSHEENSIHSNIYNVLQDQVDTEHLKKHPLVAIKEEETNVDTKARAEENVTPTESSLHTETQLKAEETVAEDQPTENPSNSEIDEALTTFQGSIERPNEVIKLDPNLMLQLNEKEWKATIRTPLANYLVSHYSEKGNEILEMIMKIQPAGMVALITIEGKLREYVSTKGFKPAENLIPTSPEKIYGSHPLASNRFRRFTIQISKTQGVDDVGELTGYLVSKLIATVNGMENHVLALCPFNASDNGEKIWEKHTISSITTGWSKYMGQEDHISWQNKVQWQIKVETSIDLQYVLNVTTARASAECEALNNDIKKKNIMIKVIDVDESNKEISAVIVNMSRYSDILNCKEEIIDRLHDISSFEISGGQLDIEWRPVELPTDKTEHIIMGAIMVDPRISELITEKLINQNENPNQELYPHTGEWCFYRGKEDEGKMYTLAEGIHKQREHTGQLETIVVSGLRESETINKIPAMDGNANINSSKRTIMQMVTTDDLETKEGKVASPFTGLFQKKNGTLVFTGIRRNLHMMRAYFKDGHFSKALHRWYGMGNVLNWPQIKAFWRKLPGNPDASTECEILSPLDSRSNATRLIQSTPTAGAAHTTNETKNVPYALGYKPAIPLGIPPASNYPPGAQFPPNPLGNDRPWGENSTGFRFGQQSWLPTPEERARRDRNRWGLAPYNSIEVPDFPGSIGKEGLQYLTNHILEQFRRQIPQITETAWNTCDPASRLFQKVLERDEVLLQTFNEMFDEALSRITGIDIVKNKEDLENSEDEGEQDETNQQNAYATPTSKTKQPDTEEAASAKVSTDIKKLVSTTEEMLEKERLEISQYASTEQKEETAELKKQFQNTPKRDTWEERLISHDAIDEHLRDQTETTESAAEGKSEEKDNHVDLVAYENEIKSIDKEMEQIEQEKKIASIESSSESSGIPDGINGETKGSAEDESQQTRPRTRSRIKTNPSDSETDAKIGETKNEKDTT